MKINKIKGLKIFTKDLIKSIIFITLAVILMLSPIIGIIYLFI